MLAACAPGEATAPAAPGGETVPTPGTTLRLVGEVYASQTHSLMPPAIDDMWQFNVTQLAPDGAPVKQGDPVLGFDSSELGKRLVEKQSLLKEKQTQLHKLLLELAERERDERLATAQALSQQEKAQRKTAQPEELVPGVQYRKLLVDRRKAEQRLALVQRREVLAAEQRRQERRLLESEVAQLQAEVSETLRSLAAMTVLAPRAGLMMHKSSWSGEKFDVGSQVWRGQAVAEIPDTSTLGVRAELPERDLLRVAVGAPARVVIEGGAGTALRGSVSGVGGTVRSKSRVQPIPILDVEITLSDHDARLKPGQPVSVEVTVPARGTTP